MANYLSKDETTRAEIIWSLSVVWYHLTLMSGGKSVDSMKLMFPDSEIAKSIKLSRSKLAYTIVYGLGPYFKSLLSSQIKESKYFCIAFDESLNKIAQKEQMDVTIRYWSESNDRPVTRYLGSVFLGHTTAADLILGFKELVQHFDLSKMLHISMDGPNANFKFLNDLKIDLTKDYEDRINLVDIGSCGIHTVHNAFKTAIKDSEWTISEFLRAIYNLFKNVPARRADYIKYSNSKIFPLKFCPTRWVENISVAERAISILPNLIKYIEGVNKDNIKVTSQSFKIVSENVKDVLLEAKFCFFIVSAGEVEPFLRQFQSDEPMLPYLFNSLNNIIKNVLGRFIKQDVLENTSVSKIDIYKSKNLIAIKNINIGYRTRSVLKKCKTLTEKDILLFKKQCQNILQKLVSKILNKSPIKYKFVRAVSFCDPKNIVDNKDICFIRLKMVIEIFSDQKRLSGMSCEKIDRNFKAIVNDSSFLEKAKKFLKDKKEYKLRLDDFWMNLLKDNVEEYHELRELFMMIFLIFHGNAAIERGFSINKECIVENQNEISLINIRYVYDAIKEAGGIENVDINKKLIQAARNARSFYNDSIKKLNDKKNKEEEINIHKRRNNTLIRELENKKSKMISDHNQSLDLIEQEIRTYKK